MIGPTLISIVLVSTILLKRGPNTIAIEVESKDYVGNTRTPKNFS